MGWGIDTELVYEGMCYVVLRTDKIHHITYNRHDLVWYPEDGMSLVNKVQYIPYFKSVVTECPWIISCYDREHVRLWDEKNKGWVRPEEQTFGASVNNITMCVLGISQTIPSYVYDGGTEIKKLIKKENKGRD